MNAEIEKLIASVKEMGSMTARQKEIILEKAKQLGGDPSEVEFALENIPIRDTTTDVKSSAVEKRRKCPNCGANLSDVFMKCPDCGYVFTGTEANKNLIRFGTELKNTSNKSLKKQIIESVAIPNDKEDLLDFLLILRPHIEDKSDPLFGSYFNKYSECIGRCQQFFKSDDDFSAHIRLYNYVLDQKKKKKKVRNVIVSLIVLTTLLLINTPPIIKKNKFENNVQAMQTSLEEGDSKSFSSSFYYLLKALENGAEYDFGYDDMLKSIQDKIKQETQTNNNIEFVEALLLSMIDIYKRYSNNSSLIL